jgi:dipeptidyl-peptidase 4
MKKILSFFLLLITVGSFSQNEQKKITLDDIFKSRKFSSRGVMGLHSMKDGVHYFQLKKDSLNVYEYSTGNLVRTIVTSKKLIPAGDTVPIDMSNLTFSADESRLLFATDEEPVYRYSFKSTYYIYDIPAEKLIPLSANGKQRLAAFSPDGSKVAFVRDNNLFVKDISSGIHSPASGIEKQITTDGMKNEVINGEADWVYEEEFDNPPAFLWSPDSKKIAFYRFDESNVKEYQLTYFGDLYPEQYKYKYPKGGETNSKIGILIYSLDSGLKNPVDIGMDTDIYIPRIRWTSDAAGLLVYRLNRHQNKLEFLLADASDGRTKTIYTEENKYFVEINDNFYFLKNNKGFLMTSEKDGYNHIYVFDMNGKPIRQLTAGKWDVTSLSGVDEANGLVYYMSSETSPLDRSLYSVSLDGKKKTRITSRPGTYTIDFSASFSYFICNWSDINTPPYITVNKAGGEEVRVLQDNAKLIPVLRENNFSPVSFFSFKLEDGTDLNGWMLKPPDFDPVKKYPVLFTIYGGPGSQTVINRWGAASSWYQLFAQHGIIVVSVDNRGTGSRGEEFKKCTYLQLGKYETLDQVSAAKYLGTLPYIDKDRLGMWGWSYGGFMTLSCLTKGADYFKLGVAVAPVTNWKYYDDIYTERYMRTPKENPDGYETNSPINHADKLKGKLLLIHGMADDNVHTQNSYDFITALVAANKQFDMQLYPNSNHNIHAGKNTTFHLYQRMTDYILTNL